MYAAITILVLAIAIGANTTVFSVLNGLFLRPLPYTDGDRLVMVYDSYTKISNLDNAGTAIPDYLERRDQAKSLESLAITAGMARTLGGDGRSVAPASRCERRRRCSQCSGSRLRSAACSRTTRRRPATTESSSSATSFGATRFGASENVRRPRHSARRRLVPRDRRDAGRVRVPEPHHRRLAAVRVHAAADHRRGTRQPVLVEHRPAAARRNARGAERRARGHRRPQPRGGPRPSRRGRSRGVHGACNVLPRADRRKARADGLAAPGQRARGAADRVRERREPPARARLGAPQRARGPRGARCTGCYGSLGSC